MNSEKLDNLTAQIKFYVDKIESRRNDNDGVALITTIRNIINAYLPEPSFADIEKDFHNHIQAKIKQLKED